MPSVDQIDDKFCRSVELPSKPNQVAYFLKLETGLSVVFSVSYGGSRLWQVLTYKAGRPHYAKLGRWPELKAKAAIAAARKYYEDPARFQAQALPDTFKAIAERWIKAHVDVKKLISRDEIVRALTKYVFPKLGNEKFVTIKRSQVSELLDFIAEHHGRTQADAVLSILRNICKWYAPNSDHFVPFVVPGMERDRRDPKEQARSRVLSDTEIKTLWENSSGPFGDILKLCLLTSQRREKVGSMRWADISDGIWSVPQKAREKNTGGELKLPRMALDIIERQSRIDGNDFVFASGERTHFNSWSLAKRKLDAQLKQILPNMEPWVVHDLRRTARSLMSRAGVRPDVAERTLGHAISGVARIYDRYSYDLEKADALQRLANLIATILDPKAASNVVPFEAASA